ncbi:MAG: CPBP family intramembrane glutamic endopeptidase [Candidatus Zhuqueibacterota bacterium]
MPSETKHTHYPTLFHALILLAIFFIITTVAALIASFTLARVLSESMNMLITYSISFSGAIFVGLLFRRMKSGATARFSFSAGKRAIYPLLIGLTLTIVALLDPITDLIPMPDFMMQLFLKLLADRSYPTFVLMVIAAPLLEEFLFRGIMLDGFLRNYSARKSIVFSSLFFALAHLNPWQFIVAFSLGLLIGYVYVHTKSLLPCMFIHFIANVAGYFARFLFDVDETQFITTRELIGNNFLYAAILLLCGILAFVLFKHLSRILVAPDGKSATTFQFENKREIGTASSVWGAKDTAQQGLE